MLINELEFSSCTANIITVSLGKKYLYEIADVFTKGHKDTEDIYNSIDDWVNSIEDKNKIYKFVLPRKLYNFIYSKKSNNVVNRYDYWDEDFRTTYLFYHMKNVYKEFVRDKKDRVNKKVHLWLHYEPTQADSYNRLDDSKPIYKSLISKFYLNKFQKYKGENSSSASGWCYQICMLYLRVMGDMYRILQLYIPSVEDFVDTCLYILNPVVTGFTFTVDYKLPNTTALALIHELKQLTTKGNYLQISHTNKSNSVEFTYSTLGSTFHHDLEDDYSSLYKGDKNGHRLVKMYVTGAKDTLTLKIDLVGLGVLDDVTGMAVQKKLYSNITDDIALQYLGKDVLKTVLSHTQQHENTLVKAIKVAPKVAKKVSIVTFAETEDEHNRITNKVVADELLYKYVFTDLHPEQKLEVAKLLKLNFPMERGQLDYIISAIELAKYDNATISLKLNGVASKQQALLRKMIKFVQGYYASYTIKPALNSIYRSISNKK